MQIGSVVRHTNTYVSDPRDLSDWIGLVLDGELDGDEWPSEADEDSEESCPCPPEVDGEDEDDDFEDEENGEWDDFEDAEEREMFLSDLGLEEPGVAKLIRTAYDLLDLQTYFTAGEKEVRAWTVKKGATAPQAAGVIHTDFEKGFIRAEVIGYNDYVEFGSEQAVKEAGKLSVEGKEYIVNDGDVMHFRFNV